MREFNVAKDAGPTKGEKSRDLIFEELAMSFFIVHIFVMGS